MGRIAARGLHQHRAVAPAVAILEQAERRRRARRCEIDNVIAYERAEGKERLLVALNLGREPREIAIERATVLLSTRLDREGERLQGRVRLRGDERLLVELSR